MTLKKLFDAFKDTAFRLEGLPVYNVPEEAVDFNKFKNGTFLSQEDNGWHGFLEQSKSQGKKIQRLRLLSQNLTDYEKFELRAYEKSLILGEEIRTTYNPEHLRNYEYDFWLFDNTWIARMNYDNDGKFIGQKVYKIDSKNKNYVDRWISIYHTATPLRTA